MKKLIIILTVLVIGIFFSFSLVYDPKKATGEAEQMQGLYIFTDSKPVMPYDYLGTVTVTFTMKGEYKEVRDKLIKKAKKDYPTADAIILHFNPGNADKCDVIKFK